MIILVHYGGKEEEICGDSSVLVEIRDVALPNEALPEVHVRIKIVFWSCVHLDYMLFTGS